MRENVRLREQELKACREIISRRAAACLARFSGSTSRTTAGRQSDSLNGITDLDQGADLPGGGFTLGKAAA
jgi:hypothetical protein